MEVWIFLTAIKGLLVLTRRKRSLMLRFTESISLGDMLLPTWRHVLIVYFVAFDVNFQGNIRMIFRETLLINFIILFIDFDWRWTRKIPNTLQRIYQAWGRSRWNWGTIQKGSCRHSCRSHHQEVWEAATKGTQEVYHYEVFAHIHSYYRCLAK